MDFPGLAQYLASLGVPGFIIGYLLWERRGLMAQLQACQVAHMADIKKYSADISTALATSTELMRANNVIQDKAASSANLISVAVDKFSLRLEHLEDGLGGRP